MALHAQHLTAYVARYYLILALINITVGASLSGSSNVLSLLQPYDFLYYSGVRAYYGGEWAKAAELLEKSITTKETLLKVRRQCYDDCAASGTAALSKLDSEEGNTWDQWALDWIQQRAECLRFCIGQSVSPTGQLPVSTDIEYEFDTRNPYNFLQVTYYKLEKVKKAASAAHTYFVANPSHLEMRNNIEKYRRMEGVSEEDFQDREIEKEKHWVSRVSCGFTLHLVHPKTTFAVKTNAKFNYLTVFLVHLRKQYVRILHIIYFLMGFCFLTAGDFTGAVQTLRSFLLFYPSDKDSLDNLQLYLETLGGDKDSHDTQPIVRYISESLEEKKLLYFGVENLDFSFTDPDLWTPEDVVPESIRDAWRAEKEKLRGAVPQVGVTLTMDDEALNGTNRVVLDGVMTEAECGSILQLASVAASVGDGYRGRRSPHTPHETFEGLTVLRALSQEGLVNQSDARLLHELGERVKTLLHSYFRSPSGLFISFTHLVCRSAVTGDQEGRLDLSHPVHVDNCLLEPETKQCWREPPAFTHRDLSAILYLNDNFDGGEAFFTKRDAKTVTAQVKPSCGRLLGFSSGPVNPHGVRAVTRGRRCALALWFTKEKIYRDMVSLSSDLFPRRLGLLGAVVFVDVVTPELSPAGAQCKSVGCLHACAH
uniref:procollagen-proline 3-dioxygenase n=1 Tax=Nothobranchius furzeri TaxID=105023 RepID=A0A8C6KHM9_NOTFU